MNEKKFFSFYYKIYIIGTIYAKLRVNEDYSQKHVLNLYPFSTNSSKMNLIFMKLLFLQNKYILQKKDIHIKNNEQGIITKLLICCTVTTIANIDRIIPTNNRLKSR